MAVGTDSIQHNACSVTCNTCQSTIIMGYRLLFTHTHIYIYAFYNVTRNTDIRTFLSCSKLVISVTEHLVEVVDKLSTTTVVFFRFKRILKCKCLYGAYNAYWVCSDACWEVKLYISVISICPWTNMSPTLNLFSTVFLLQSVYKPHINLHVTKETTNCNFHL